MRDKCLWIHIIQKYRYTKFHENRMHTYRMVALNWTNEQHSQGVLVSPHRGVNIRSYDLIWSLLFWIQHKEALLDQLTKKLHLHMIYEKRRVNSYVNAHWWDTLPLQKHDIFSNFCLFKYHCHNSFCFLFLKIRKYGQKYGNWCNRLLKLLNWGWQLWLYLSWKKVSLKLYEMSLKFPKILTNVPEALFLGLTAL